MDVKKGLLTYTSILLTVLFWSFSYIWTKLALICFSVYALVLFRFLIASGIFLILIFIKKLPKFEKKDFIKLIIISLFFPFLYYLLETLALSYTSASEAGIIAAILPVIVLILSTIFIKEKTSVIGVGGILFSFIGLYLLITGNVNGKLYFSNNLLGNFLMICSMFSAAIYMVIAKTLSKKYSSLSITGTQIMLGTLFLIIFSFFNFKQIKIVQLSIISIISLLCLSLLSTIVAFFCYNYSLKNLSAAKASIFINGVPFITALIAWLILGDKLTIVQIIGGVIIILSVILTNIFGTFKINLRSNDKKIIS